MLIVHVLGGLRTSSASFSSNSSHLISSNWSGQVSIWTVPNCQNVLHLQGHGAKVGCARFRPGAFDHLPAEGVNAASCDFDGNVLLWSAHQPTPLAHLENHGSRVSRVAFHPSGDFLGSTW